MNSKQYEELCRRFLADKLGIDVDKVLSVDIPNPRRPGLPEYKHQIDLYWETGNEVTLYLNIANAKWRGSDKVDQPEVLLLQKVKEKVGAHKSVMITNTDFTAGARAVAQDEGVALHIVRPSFDFAALDKKNSTTIQAQICLLSTSASIPIYFHMALL
jgi:Restriction endonuclease